MNGQNTIFLADNSTEIVEEIQVEAFPEGQSNVENMIDTLPYMGKGMVGILLVTVIIITSVVLLNKFTGKKNQ